MGLTEYHRKRDFKKTKEPRGKVHKDKSGPQPRRFIIQKHAASHLHYDFRLELDGVLKSWAVPKGPSMNPKDKRLAMQVEDHPVEYGDFEGIIPEGEYGGGTVMLWDIGEWEPLLPDADPIAELESGSMKIRLKGQRLTGGFALILMKGGKYSGDKEKRSWLLIKEKDDDASDETLITEQHTTSVTTGRTMEDIAAGKPAKGKRAKAAGGLRVWSGQKDAADQTGSIDPSQAEGARKSPFPSLIKPQLATLVDTAPLGENWAHEIKFDGYRFLVYINKGKVELITRNGKDWTGKFPSIAKAFQQLPVESAIVDGELVAVGQDGTSKFQLLQNAVDGTSRPSLLFYAFDLVYLNGYLLKKTPLESRKDLLRDVMLALPDGTPLHFSEHFKEDGDRVWEKACKMGMEGIISKDLTATYIEKRTQSWVKVKCSARQEFVIGGFSAPGGSRLGFGALLVGYHNEDKDFIYAGKVGTGFTDATLKKLHKQMSELTRKTSPFKNPPKGAWLRGVTWIEPSLIAEIAYMEMTDEGLLRHPSFKGLREDKPAKAVSRETPKKIEETPAAMPRQTKSTATTSTKSRSSKSKSEKPAAKSSAKSKAAASTDEHRLTNPDRVLFSDEGYTKQDLFDYYAAVEERAFPWLVDRPITLVRCPAGRKKPCFYQRHSNVGEMPGIEPVDVDVKGGTETYIYLAEPAGLYTLVQQSTLEIHGWQCKASDVDRPDRMIFDIDPSPEVGWPEIIEAAKTIKKLLEKCGFTTFPMTTGGKGIHVVVPLKPQAGWDEVINFAEAIARYLEATQPEKFTANLSKKKRVGRVFVDYLRNHKTASAILPYSSRARTGATVATPVTWRDVTQKLDPSKFTIKTIPARITRQKQDPWHDYEKSRRELHLDEVISRLQST